MIGNKVIDIRKDTIKKVLGKCILNGREKIKITEKVKILEKEILKKCSVFATRLSCVLNAKRNIPNNMEKIIERTIELVVNNEIT